MTNVNSIFMIIPITLILKMIPSPTHLIPCLLSKQLALSYKHQTHNHCPNENINRIINIL